MRSKTIVLAACMLLILAGNPALLATDSYTSYSADRSTSLDTVDDNNNGVVEIPSEANSVETGTTGQSLVTVRNSLNQDSDLTVELSTSTVSSWQLSNGATSRTITKASGTEESFTVDVPSSATTATDVPYYVRSSDGTFTFSQTRTVDVVSGAPADYELSGSETVSDVIGFDSTQLELFGPNGGSVYTSTVNPDGVSRGGTLKYNTFDTAPDGIEYFRYREDGSGGYYYEDIEVGSGDTEQISGTYDSSRSPALSQMSVVSDFDSDGNPEVFFTAEVKNKGSYVPAILHSEPTSTKTTEYAQVGQVELVDYTPTYGTINNALFVEKVAASGDARYGYYQGDGTNGFTETYNLDDTAEYSYGGIADFGVSGDSDPSSVIVNEDTGEVIITRLNFEYERISGLGMTGPVASENVDGDSYAEIIGYSEAEGQVVVIDPRDKTTEAAVGQNGNPVTAYKNWVRSIGDIGSITAG